MITVCIWLPEVKAPEYSLYPQPSIPFSKTRAQVGHAALVVSDQQYTTQYAYISYWPEVEFNAAVEKYKLKLTRGEADYRRFMNKRSSSAWDLGEAIDSLGKAVYEKVEDLAMEINAFFTATTPVLIGNTKAVLITAYRYDKLLMSLYEPFPEGATSLIQLHRLDENAIMKCYNDIIRNPKYRNYNLYSQNCSDVVMTALTAGANFKQEPWYLPGYRLLGASSRLLLLVGYAHAFGLEVGKLIGLIQKEGRLNDAENRSLVPALYRIPFNLAELSLTIFETIGRMTPYHVQEYAKFLEEAENFRPRQLPW